MRIAHAQLVVEANRYHQIMAASFTAAFCTGPSRHLIPPTEIGLDLESWLGYWFVLARSGQRSDLRRIGCQQARTLHREHALRPWRSAGELIEWKYARCTGVLFAWSPLDIHESLATVFDVCSGGICYFLWSCDISGNQRANE